MIPRTLELAGLVLPLGLDTFAVALGLGIAGLPARQTLRLSLLFAVFEAAMPLIGVAAGAGSSAAIGGGAGYAATALLAALGLYMLLDNDGATPLALRGRGVLGLLALGIGISLDELAIGFSAGLLGLPTVPLVAAIALQALLVTQIGVRLGSRVGERLREGSERLAGAALIALAAILLIERLVSS